MMAADIFSKTVFQSIDKLVLYTMNMRVSNALQETMDHAPTLAAVLADTEICREKTADYAFYNLGQHPIWVTSRGEEIPCRVRIAPAPRPDAPLMIYHHGIGEMPYYNSWWRLFSSKQFQNVHRVCVQAPYHDNFADPFEKGFASVEQIYKMFAGSLRITEFIQSYFEEHGAGYTVVGGVSWGGITSVIYESLFQNTQAIIPMFSSPNLAQVMWDLAEMFKRPLSIEREQIDHLLDFTTYYNRCDPARVFPLLGENDLFFRYDHHADIFADAGVQCISRGHITGSWSSRPLRRHITDVLLQAHELPLAVY
mgnify:CR=1 FL=1